MAIFDAITHYQIANEVILTYGDLNTWDIQKWTNYSKAILPVYHNAIEQNLSPYKDADPGPSIQTIEYIIIETNLPYLVVWRYLNALEIAAKSGRIASQLHDPRIETDITTPGEKPGQNETVKEFTERQINKALIGGAMVLTVYLIARKIIQRG